MSSAGVYGGDEVGAIVIDIGSHTIRGGFAGEDMPKADFPTMVGVDKSDVSDANSDSIRGSETLTQRGTRKYYIDTVNIKVPRSHIEMCSFLEDGLVEDWDIFEKVINYLYVKQLRSTPHEHPLLMSEPAWNITEKREKLTEIMFEKFNVPAFYLCKNAVLSAFANGRPTGLVLDSGSVHTSAVPVYDGFVLQQGVVRSSLGGNSVLAECRKLCDDMSIDITPQYMIAHKDVVVEGQPAKWKRKESLPHVTKSYNDYCVREVLQDFASSVLQVPEGPYDEEVETIESTPPLLYEMPNGYCRRFATERFKIAETLFNPLFMTATSSSGTALTMTQLVTSSIGLCDIDIRPSLFNSVMVVGGNSLLNGFCDRLNIDLISKIPPDLFLRIHRSCADAKEQSMKLKLISSSVNAERRFSSWIGGSILSSLTLSTLGLQGSFQQLWLSKQEYEESGKGCIEKKCP